MWFYAFKNICKFNYKVNRSKPNYARYILKRNFKRSLFDDFRARLKNVDRSSATYHSVTVDDFTVVITEFKPKVKKEKKDSEKKNNNDKNDKNGEGPSKNGNAGGPGHDPKTEPGDPEPGSGGGGGSGENHFQGSGNAANGNGQPAPQAPPTNLQNSVTTTNHRVEVMNDTRSS